jgi:phenylalanyl-tRNA synthetase beta chain
MLAPLSWLKDFAPFPDDIALLRSTLDDLGLVVEGVEIVGEGLNDVIVAKVSTISAIEGADRIRHVVVDDGSDSVEIVCGAMNFVEGDLVPLAPVGAILPGNFKIASRKMKGVTSNGMLCSGKELGLGDDHDGLMILTDVPGAEPGSSLVNLLEIEPDVIFDVTVEGTRPDAWSISGLARDLAARLGLVFTPVTPAPPAASGPSTSELASGEVINEELCSRLGVGVLSNVVVGPSPQLIAQRLTKAGMRPINNVVDASNYVMLELGQPTHPYDLDKIEGKGLRVRTATPGESLVTLDGVTRELGVAGRSLGDTGQDLVICDANDVVVGIAGIMGGESSEISGDTSSVLLEAARFDPITITRTSRRFA